MPKGDRTLHWVFSPGIGWIGSTIVALPLNLAHGALGSVCCP